jgi:hypothetical protein
MPHVWIKCQPAIWWGYGCGGKPNGTKAFTVKKAIKPGAVRPIHRIDKLNQSQRVPDSLSGEPGKRFERRSGTSDLPVDASHIDDLPA